jgi:hypothetical protein
MLLGSEKDGDWKREEESHGKISSAIILYINSISQMLKIKLFYIILFYIQIIYFPLQGNSGLKQ